MSQSSTPAVAVTPKPLISRTETLAIAGGCGMFAWCFAHPFEMWKNTLMMSPKGISQMEVLKKTAQKGFYTGLGNGLARQIVYTTARLGCYPMFREAILNGEVALGLRKDANPVNASMVERALAGASAGVFASMLSSPVEVCLVLQTTSKEKLSMVRAVTGVWKNSGLLGFWRGFGALGTRAGLVGIAQVAVHDQVLTKLRIYNRKRAAPLNDNLVVNIASVITAFIYGVITMPVEMARVRMSAEAKLPPGQVKKYTNTLQCISRVAKEEGLVSVFDAFLPYFCRCASHTVICFFCLEYVTRTLKTRRAAEQEELKQKDVSLEKLEQNELL